MAQLINSIDEFVTYLIETLADKKAENIKSFDVSGRSIITDRIIIISVANTIHCKSIITHIKENIEILTAQQVDSDQIFCAPKISGSADSGWVIIDTNTVLIHILLDQLREYYNLDGLFEQKAETYYH